MEPRVYQGKADAANSNVHIITPMGHDERMQLDGQRVFIIPETHHLYEWIREEYLPRRKFIEDKIKRGGNDVYSDR